MPRTLNVTTAPVAQAPTGLAEAVYRATLVDGSARVLVADRRVDFHAPDVRVRADKPITVRRAANSLAHRWGWTREQVLAYFGAEDSREVARGGLREAYLAEQGQVRVG